MQGLRLLFPSTATCTLKKLLTPPIQSSSSSSSYSYTRTNLFHQHQHQQQLCTTCNSNTHLHLHTLFSLHHFLKASCHFFRMQGTFYLVYFFAICMIICNDHHTLLYALPAVFDPQMLLLSSFSQPYGTSRRTERNKEFVETLQHYGVIKSKKVADVMGTIDRGLFVSDETLAYVDSPMSIGYNATISAPHMHAMCLELLEQNLQPGMRALDVGSGTGYLTACFAKMVEKQGHVVGVEHIPELADSSVKNIEKSAAAPLLKDGALQIHVGDGREGWPEHAPYDAIHVGAAAPEIPRPLIDQLKPGGRMVIPVGNMFQDLKVVDKNQDGSISVRSETPVRYVPLTSRDSQIQGI
ncbi:hypothetical protein ACFE04_027977 [Oxalis oulophora]